MRTRQEIKAIGKERFQAFYWPSVGALFLVSLVMYLITMIGTNTSALTQAAISGDPAALDAAIEETAGRGSATTILSLFLDAPLTIGLCFFFVQLILGRTEGLGAGTPFSAGFSGYGRKLGGYILMQVFTFLWSLLLVIPGIIKSFSYAMTPYILSDCPNVAARDAIKLSMRIMSGRKWQFFVFGLSFIGWALLSVFTLGLLQLFYVGPYIQSASACWYLEAREAALRNGVITMGQLEGTEPV